MPSPLSVTFRTDTPACRVGDVTVTERTTR
jgi:hypothetical protein